MKYRWDKKYLYWGVTAFFAICASILFYYLLFHGTSIKSSLSKFLNILMPIIDGLIIAYLLRPVLNWFERNVFLPLYKKFNVELNKTTRKRMRSFSLILTMGFFIIIIYAFFAMVIPQLLESLQSIVSQFPTYVSNLEIWINNILKNNSHIETIANNLISQYSGTIETLLNNKVIPQINVVLKEVSLSVINIAVFLWNFIIGFIISIYLLGSKEKFAGQSKKTIYALFNEENANNIIEDVRFIDKTFGGYIIGKIIDSIIIGILCFLGMQLLKLPYPLLISVIVGVTNVIPFFGPYMGAIPSAILILMINPSQMLIFALFILVLQQFDGNVLGPKILGNSTGISSFWVISSITIFGGFFGVLGMAIGVPIFAVIYAAFKRSINKMLEKKELATNSLTYQTLDKVEGGEFKELESSLPKKYFNKESSGTSFTDFKDKVNKRKQDENKKG